MTDQYVPSPPYSDYEGWVDEYMPGYPTENFGNITKSIPECRPASYYGKYFWGLDPVSAKFYHEADGKTELPEPIPATEEEYRAAYAAMNYFVNGNKTPAGRPLGINPNKLLGGTKSEVNGYDDKVVLFPDGSIYEYGHAPSASNDMRGENAYFYKYAGADKSWESDLYDGTQYEGYWTGPLPPSAMK